MESPVEEIKKKTDIVELVGSYVDLKKAGRNFKGLCPFHQEKTPSFIVSPERQIWHCFGACHTGGDVISFLMKIENLTFGEAIEELAKRAGVELKKSVFVTKIGQQKENLKNLNYYAAKFFHYVLLHSKKGRQGLDYLEKRNINLGTINKFSLGYDFGQAETLFKFLKEKGFSDKDIYSADLVISRGRQPLSRFAGRLIFPLRDMRGNTLGFSGRLIHGDKKAKYLNTRETVLYHKRETLFGIDIAKESIKKSGNVFLVEGEFDVLSPYQQGINNIVAIKGSAVTEDQLTLLKRLTKRITLILDMDKAGQEAILRTIDRAEEADLETYIVTFDFAKDPDEAVQKDSVAFKKALKNPISFYDYLVSKTLKETDYKTAFGKKEVAEKVLPYLSRIKNPIVKSHYYRRLSEILDVDRASLVELVRKEERQAKVGYRRKKVVSEKENKEKREIVVERFVLSYILQAKKAKELFKKMLAIINSDDFYLPVYQKIVYHLDNYFRTNSSFDLQTFSKKLPKELLPAFDEIYLFASINGNESNNFNQRILFKTIYEIKKLSLKRRINELSSAKKIGKRLTLKIEQLLSQLAAVEKKMITL